MIQMSMSLEYEPASEQVLEKLEASGLTQTSNRMGKEYQFQPFMAMQFTARMLYYC